MAGVRLSYPTMSQSQEPAPRRRSAFVAAFLSLLFPGLGHAYAGAFTRALGFAAAPGATVCPSAVFALVSVEASIGGRTFIPVPPSKKRAQQEALDFDATGEQAPRGGT